jgi:hypothetical protein
MFDVSLESGDKWHKPVEDAVLDKSAGAEITHIAVDATSTDGCVYVRSVENSVNKYVRFNGFQSGMISGLGLLNNT